jgi:hypothetical protein
MSDIAAMKFSFQHSIAAPSLALEMAIILAHQPWS